MKDMGRPVDDADLDQAPLKPTDPATARKAARTVVRRNVSPEALETGEATGPELFHVHEALQALGLESYEGWTRNTRYNNKPRRVTRPGTLEGATE